MVSVLPRKLAIRCVISNVWRLSVKCIHQLQVDFCQSWCIFGNWIVNTKGKCHTCCEQNDWHFIVTSKKLQPIVQKISCHLCFRAKQLERDFLDFWTYESEHKDPKIMDKDTNVVSKGAKKGYELSKSNTKLTRKESKNVLQNMMSLSIFSFLKNSLITFRERKLGVIFSKRKRSIVIWFAWKKVIIWLDFTLHLSLRVWRFVHLPIDS